MRSLTAVIAAVLMAVFPIEAFACVTIHGPYSGNGIQWYAYELDPDCASTTGNVTTTTMCEDVPGLAFGMNGSSATYSFVVGPTDPVLANWSVDLLVEWHDPAGSFLDNIIGTVSVTRNGTKTTSTIFSFNGTVTRNCTLETAQFNAQRGDIIEISIHAYIYSTGVTANVGRPLVFTTS